MERPQDDPRRRRPKPSTVHGWLCKMRGTIIGNERMRQQGRREMQEARAARTSSKRPRPKATQSKPILSFLIGGGGGGKPPARSRPKQKQKMRHAQGPSSRALVPYAHRGARPPPPPPRGSGRGDRPRPVPSREKSGRSAGAGARHAVAREPQRHRSQTAPKRDAHASARRTGGRR